MTPQSAPSLSIGPDGCRVRLDDGEVLDLALNGAPEDSALLRRLFGGRASITAAVDPEHVLELPCTHSPPDLWRWLAQHAPLVPRALVWTRPFASADDGQQIVTLVRKDWLAKQCRRLEAASRVPVRPVVAGTEVPFRFRSPLARARWLTSLGVIGLSLAVAGAALAGRTTAPEPEDRGTAPASGKAAELYSGPGFALTLAEALSDLPPKANLVALASPAIGRPQVEFLTLDPDELRLRVKGTPFSGRFSEAGHLRQPDMMFRVTYSAKAAVPAPDLAEAQRARLISAASAGDAEAVLRNHVETAALSEKLSLRILPDGRQEPGILRLHIQATGRQEAILAFAQALESGPPPARLAAWRLEPDPAGLRLGAELAAAWNKPE